MAVSFLIDKTNERLIGLFHIPTNGVRKGGNERHLVFSKSYLRIIGYQFKEINDKVFLAEKKTRRLPKSFSQNACVF